MLMIQYLQNNGEKIELNTINKPDKEYSSFGDPLNFGLEHERYVQVLYIIFMPPPTMPMILEQCSF